MVISAVEGFFGDRESVDTTGIQALQHRWKKCVDRRGDYMLKNKPLFVQILTIAESTYELFRLPSYFKTIEVDFVSAVIPHEIPA